MSEHLSGTHKVVLEMVLTSDQYEDLETWLDDNSVVPSKHEHELLAHTTDPNADAFNPHGNTTTDGVLITRGLRVLDYDRRETVVVADRDCKDWKCCGQHARKNDLSTDYSGCDSACMHDHWYDLENGAMMNGARLRSIR